MRTTLLTGLALLVGGLAVVLLSSGFDLELESTALMGAAIGAVVALVPDRTPGMRIAGFLVGFVAAWAGYLARAALLPDTSGGRAVALALVIVVCVGVVALTMNRVPLWSVLLGAAALAGGYEANYAAAPSEVVDTSMTAVTTVLLTIAVGFLAGALVAPKPVPSPVRQASAARDEAQTTLDSIMETSR